MKKTCLAASIAATAFCCANARADIAVTRMDFGNSYGVSGTVLSGGGGVIASVDPFFGQHWTATQQTPIMDNSGSWAGTSPQGAWDYTSAITGIPVGSSAAGFSFCWGSCTGIPVLAIWDCDDDASGDVCNGTGTPMQTGPFPFQAPAFHGHEIVPVPSAAWLMGSGLLGLVGVARRRQAST